MSQSELSVTGIGNAIVDIASLVSDEVVQGAGFVKGSMSLVDIEHALTLSNLLTSPTQSSGGSAANTIAGLAALGSRAGYIGKLGTDTVGEVFSESLASLGVEFRTTASTRSTPTARCIVLVTPDAQRTMCTYLGACVELGPEDVDTAMVARSKVTYLEGYLWDPPQAKQAFILAAKTAHAAGRQVSLSLSDSFCVARHRESFLELVKNHVDVLFANESELMSLYETDSVETALALAKDQCRVTAVTCGAAGCLIAWDGVVTAVAAEPVTSVVDTTGAGDLFAAGFLHGFCEGRSAVDCGTLGGIAAAEVISHFGARPQQSLRELALARMGG